MDQGQASRQGSTRASKVPSSKFVMGLSHFEQNQWFSVTFLVQYYLKVYLWLSCSLFFAPFIRLITIVKNAWAEMDVFVWQNARTFAHTHAKSRQNKQLIIILFIHSTRPLLCQSIKIQLSMYFFLLLRLRFRLRRLLLPLLLLLSHTIHDSQFFSCRLLIRLCAFLHLLLLLFCMYISFYFVLFYCLCHDVLVCTFIVAPHRCRHHMRVYQTKYVPAGGMMETKLCYNTTYENMPPTTWQQQQRAHTPTQTVYSN